VVAFKFRLVTPLSSKLRRLRLIFYALILKNVSLKEKRIVTLLITNERNDS
jgi:hypothetical protein